MYKDSYNQRLKEIRQKYGATIKDTTTCLKSNDKITSRFDSKYQDNYNDKITSTRKFVQNYSDKKNSENVDPYSTSFSSKYTTSLLKQTNQDKSYDSFLYTQNKDERLKEIQKIRKEFAESRNKAVNDYNRTLQKSKNKYLEVQKHAGLKQRSNLNSAYNPQDFKQSIKEAQTKQNYRNRPKSSYTGANTKPDLQLNKELRRNYDYNFNYEVSSKQNRINDKIDNNYKTLTSFRNNSVSKVEKDNMTSMAYKKDYGITDDFRNMRSIDSQTTSPIRGLMKFDSVQKPKKTQNVESLANLTKISQNNYDLSNIDKIQQRIQKILAKK